MLYHFPKFNAKIDEYFFQYGLLFRPISILRRGRIYPSPGVVVDGETAISTKPDWGLQIGAGYFINKNVGVDISSIVKSTLEPADFGGGL